MPRASRSGKAKTWLAPAFAGIGVFVIGLLVYAAFFISVQPTQTVRALNDTNWEGPQWHVNNTEIEFLRFKSALTEARYEATPDLDGVRRAYDIFFSRATTLRQGQATAVLRENQEFREKLAELNAYLETSAAIVDLPPGTLRTRLDDLAVLTDAIYPVIRRMSLTTLGIWTEGTITHNADVADTILFVTVSLSAGSLLLLVAVAAMGSLYMVADRRRAAIEAAGRLRDTILTQSRRAVLVADEGGRVIQANAEARMLFNAGAETKDGEPIHDLIGRPLATLVPGAPALRDTGSSERDSRILNLRRLSGARFEAAVQMCKARPGDAPLTLLFLTDVTEQREAERRLREAHDRAVTGEKAKARFLAVMSHEIRTPLNGLLGSLSLLSDTSLGPEQARYVRNMQSTGDRLLGLVNNVLDISREEAGLTRLRPAPFDLADLVSSVVDGFRDLAAEKGLALTVRLPDPPAPKLEGDRLLLAKVLQNLVGNAIKFTERGFVAVLLSAEPRASSDQDGPAVTYDLILTVTDTGPGIPPNILPRIFDDFETGFVAGAPRAGGSSGLGLGIARRVMSAMGGWLDAQSDLGEGSTFSAKFSLPAASLAPRPDRTDLGTDASPPQDATPIDALVVEDVSVNRMVLESMLLKDGHLATTAKNGAEAVARCAEAQFDLILMDINMPVMDGETAARTIRERRLAGADTVLCAVTAYAMPEEISRLRQAGFEHILSKPIERSRLRALLRDVQARKRRSDRDRHGRNGAIAPTITAPEQPDDSLAPAEPHKTSLRPVDQAEVDQPRAIPPSAAR